MASVRRIIVGMSGASGAQLGVRLLEALQGFADVQTHLVMSEGAKAVLRAETDLETGYVESLADVVYDNRNLAAPISSGSFATDGMVVCPCSMKTLAALACAFDDDLLVRAADVCRKEGRRVVLVPRETPLNQAHLRNLLRVADDGYTVMPPMLTFYNDSQTLDEQIDHIVGKVLMRFGMEYGRFRPWEGR